MEYDSPNYAEYSYSQKNEGRARVNRVLMICFYVLYIVGFFIFATTSGFIPLFAIGPLTLYIIVLCTWRLVVPEFYVEFKIGTLYLGKVKSTKHGRRRMPKISVIVKDALEVFEYTGKSQLREAKKVYDYSESPTSDKRICVIYDDKGIKSAVIFEGTAKLASLLSSFCAGAHDIKGKTFHG